MSTVNGVDILTSPFMYSDVLHYVTTHMYPHYLGYVHDVLHGYWFFLINALVGINLSVSVFSQALTFLLTRGRVPADVMTIPVSHTNKRIDAATS